MSVKTFIMALTFSRAMIPPFFAVYAYLGTLSPLTIFCVFSIFALSDFFDGYLARKYHQTSALGAWLDHVSDKIMVFSFWPLYLILYPSFILFVCYALTVLREVWALALRAAPLSITPGRGENFSVSFLGKIKTTTQCLGLGGLFLAQSLECHLMHTVFFFSILVSTFLAWFSLFLYVWNLKNFFKIS